MPGVPIFLCAWHVKQACLINAKQKVQCKDNRTAIWEALDELMRFNVDVPSKYSDEQLMSLVKERLQAFCSRSAAETAFIEYFKKEWARKVDKLPVSLVPELFRLKKNMIMTHVSSTLPLSRMGYTTLWCTTGLWCQIFRNVPHCNQETTGTNESYHKVLKVHKLFSLKLLM